MLRKINANNFVHLRESFLESILYKVSSQKAYTEKSWSINYASACVDFKAFQPFRSVKAARRDLNGKKLFSSDMAQLHYRPWQHTANSSLSIWCVRIAGSYSHMPRRPFEIQPRRAVIRDGDAGFLLHGSIALEDEISKSSGG